MATIYLNAVGVLCSAGNSMDALVEGLQSDTNFMTLTDAFSDKVLPIGLCHDALPSIPLSDSKWQSRNNQFALFAYQQIMDQVEKAKAAFGENRVGVVIGTSTSGLADAESAVKSAVNQEAVPESYDYGIQEMGNTASFIAEIAGISGPVYGISTACSSGAKALISAKRLIKQGVCDVVIAGGVDTLCQVTVQGFSSLEAVSDSVCNPFSQHRKGINIGEAAALFVVSEEREGAVLRGVGESSDGYHISAPEPNGKGAEQCMRMALKDAGISPDNVDYINLHGTATDLNDQMEARAVHRVFGDKVPSSSTKPFTGHTLGAAGALEAAIIWSTVTSETGFTPKQRWDGVYGEMPLINLVTNDRLDYQVQCALSNSFAFGGNNVALILERIT